ncbi:hypothetical protein AVEN_223193-1 [Araneus ventricosus]|uniref:Uncharacterized protein n=1 Tax=Araneus ventricosus TaxID=182803 RepID=A0A4Y2VUB3_ARAVE|nr:hypothetical protein AVEN_223193-1 [Araneus ventricosus]
MAETVGHGEDNKLHSVKPHCNLAFSNDQESDTLLTRLRVGHYLDIPIAIYCSRTDNNVLSMSCSMSVKHIDFLECPTLLTPTFEDF